MPPSNIIFSIIFGIIVCYPIFRICRRAGLPWWPATLVFVPIIGMPIAAYILAISRWPKHPFGR